MASSPLFKHEAMLQDGHIRLLRFEEENDQSDGPLRFSLTTSVLSEHCIFNALSYEWGKRLGGQTIIVNGLPFRVGKNLHDFLQRLRTSEYKHDPIFVDAVCLDQDNIGERNRQVQMMGDIYRRATCVLVWLGPGAAESDLIFDLCHNFENSQKTQDDIEQSEKPAQIPIDINGDDGKALDTVYCRSYWTRLWIIQELFLAKQAQIFCGSRSVSWSTFPKLPKTVSGFIVQDNLNPSGFNMMLGSSPAGRHSREILSELSRGVQPATGESPRRLDELVVKFGRAQCLDVRDRVYGLLGLACESPAGSGRGMAVQADYGIDLPTLFVRLLATVPYELRLKHALDLYDLLQLHEENASPLACDFISEISPSVAEIPFRIQYTRLGYLLELKEDYFHHEGDQESFRSFQQRLDSRMVGKKCFSIRPDRIISTWACHGGGPLEVLGPRRFCVAPDTAEPGDEVYLLEYSQMLLIRQRPSKPGMRRGAPDPGLERPVMNIPEQIVADDTIGFTYFRGITALATQQWQDSILEACGTLDALQPLLPSLEQSSTSRKASIDQETERQMKAKENGFMRPTSILTEECNAPRHSYHRWIPETVTLRQVVEVVAKAGEHSDHWNRPLVEEDGQEAP